MKKLKLRLEGKGVLSKDQMRKIVGAYGPCDNECANDSDCAQWPKTPHCKSNGADEAYCGAGSTVMICLP